VSARPPIISVPRSLYKHFAVVTVAITLCVAMFADGSKREQFAEQIRAHQASQVRESRQAEDERRPMVGGLRDNRGGSGYVVNNNPDVGAIRSGPPTTFALPLDEMGELGETELPEGWLAKVQPTPKRKLPPVLPPGMSPLPGVPDAAEGSAAPSATAA
jgi:hypothetical protein